jgi:hypothetical protein
MDTTSNAKKQYASVPPMTIDPQKQYTAVVKMEKGEEFLINLYADKAPSRSIVLFSWRGRLF